MSKSTVTTRREKPKKPRPDFPLYPHAVGKWCKTIRGKTYYFGRWDDPEGALNEYLDVADDLFAGRTPTGRGNALTIANLCNEFHRRCQAKVEAGEMVERTLRDYTATTDLIVRVFGKRQSVEGLRPNDFARLRSDIAKRRGPVSLSNEITRIRVVFNYAKKNLLIESDVKYGGAFDRPTKKTLRKARAKNGKKMFDAADCRNLIDNSHTPELKAMILLALNCGFGNSDCAKLPLDAVDLNAGWLDFPRPKTGIDRRCPLWPETIKALRLVLERREKRERNWINRHNGQPCPLVFLTKYGTSFENDATTVTHEFGKLLDAVDLRQSGRSFYALRHTFRTIADATRDFPACRAIMGHADDSMDAVYNEGVDDDRWQAVVDHVRAWVWPK